MRPEVKGILACLAVALVAEVLYQIGCYRARKAGFAAARKCLTARIEETEERIQKRHAKGRR